MAQPAVTGEAAPPPRSVRTPAELVALVREDARFCFFQVLGHGDQFVEIGLSDGSVVMVWPSLWQDRAELAPHLVRARSGYSPLVLLGSDEDFASGAVDL